MTSDKEKNLSGLKGENDKDLEGLFGEAPSFKLSWEDPGPTTQRFKISDLPREVRYSLKHTSKLSLLLGFLASLILFAGGLYLIKRKPPVTRQMMATEEKVLLPLPSDLKSTPCSAVLWEGEVRQELLSAQDQNVKLRVYDCLQFLKAHGVRDRYGKKLVFADFNIYRNIVHVLYGEPSVPGSFGDCSKAPKNQACLADAFLFRSKGNRIKLKTELSKSIGESGLRNTLAELMKAELAFREGNFPLFRKGILSSVQACPRNLTGLRSEILSWAQIRLLMGGSLTEAANFGNINLKILEKEDKNTSWKARYLAQYASPGTKEKLIQHAFSKTGVIHLVKSPELLSVIIPEGIRLKMATQILSRFDLVRDFQSLEGVSQRTSEEKVILWKARVLLSLKKYQEAELLLASWLKSSSPVSGEFWYVRGLASSKLAQLKPAQLYFQKARQGGLSHWALFWNLGYVAAKLGQSRQASEFVVEALKDVGGARGERQAWMQLVLAESALKQNNGPGSVALTRRFLNSFPTDPAGWELLSRALKRMGKRAESVKAGMKLDELEAQLRYYLTDRYLFAPNGPFSGLP